MQYRSLTTTLNGVSLRDALLSTGAKDGSVLMPETLTSLPRAFINNCSEMRAGEIAYVVDNLLFGSDIPSSRIKDIVDTALSFPLPVVKVDDNIFALELFHGPTMTIKDIPARFLAPMLKALGVTELNLVIATTGNNGAAVANAIQNVEGFNAYVLFPKGTSRSIVARFTGKASNVRAIEVDGSIDDCRRLARAVQNDPMLNEKFLVSTAGTLNLGQILTTVFLYVYAFARVWDMTQSKPNVQFAIPSANCAAITSALMARKMSLPMLPPVAAIAAERPTSAYALEVSAAPTNLERLTALGGDEIFEEITNSEIAETINEVHALSGYTFDPHGAAAYAALKRNLPAGATGVVLATAHPALSIDNMTQITGRAIELPLSLTRFMGIQPETLKIPPTLAAFRRILAKT